MVIYQDGSIRSLSKDIQDQTSNNWPWHKATHISQPLDHDPTIAYLNNLHTAQETEVSVESEIYTNLAFQVSATAVSSQFPEVQFWRHGSCPVFPVAAIFRSNESPF